MMIELPEGTEPYQLPDGRIVRVDATASRGAPVIDFTLKGGKIVNAVRVPPTAALQYRTTCETAWSGDQWGNEWRLSWVVLRESPGGMLGEWPWAVYSDDSVALDGTPRNGGQARNGDFEQSFETFDEACRYADRRAVLADERGY
jgi:hypothetical protein